MKKIKILLLSIFLSMLIVSAFAQTDTSGLKITNLIGDFYIYTTYRKIDSFFIPSNGMYVVTKKGVVLFDTPFDSTQYQALLDSIALKHIKKVLLCIATHFHSDRTGGLEYYKSKGIATYSTKATDELCKKHHEKRARYIIANNTTFKVGKYYFETYFAGAGHTDDNIVVWFKKEKILYAGCLVKDTAAKDLGNVDDANVKEWNNTINNLEKEYKNAAYVIPGHGNWGGTNLLTHTLDLLKEDNVKKATKKK